MVMMREMSLDDCDEKSEKKNDQDEVDGIRQEVYSRSEQMHDEIQCWEASSRGAIEAVFSLSWS